MTAYDRSLKRRTVLGALGAGFVALPGCSAVTGAEGDAHLRLATLQPPVTLDPFEAKYVGSLQAVSKVFDGLYAYDDDTGVVPRIADGQPRTGDDGFTVDIDDAARFQNGAAVTAEDVRYSLLGPVEERAPAQVALDVVDDVEAVSERTVRFRLAHPYADVARVLTRPIVPKSVREDDPESFATDPVGAGPYRVRSFSEEREARLARWDDYWGSPTPAVASLSVVSVESPITQMMGLKTGRTDVIEPVAPQIHDRLSDVTGATIRERTGFRSYYLGFNLNEGPTTKRPVREAIGLCLDVDEAVSELIAPVGERRYSILPRSVSEEWGFPVEEWRDRAPGKNLERAARLFEEADETSGQLRILTAVDPLWKELAETLARGLRDAGHAALVTAKPWASYLESHVSGAAGEYAVFVGEVAGTPDPDSFLYPVFHENAQGLTNGIFYNEESAMNRIRRARETTDRATRRELYASVLGTLLDERVYVPLCSFRNSFAYTDDVRGFRVHPLAELNPRLVNQSGPVTVGDA